MGKKAKPRTQPASTASAAEGVSLTRRMLVVGGGAAVAGLGIWGATALRKPGVPASAKKRGTIIGAGKYFTADEPEKPKFVLCLIDLDGGRNTRIEFSFLGHGFSPDPTNARRAVFFEKKGPGACEVDLVEGRVLRPITSPKNRHFYGHGAFTRDGKILFAAENNLDTYRGLIVIRDGKTFQELGEFPTYGMNPHDCHLIDDGKTLAITNGGGTIDDATEIGAPSVTFVEVESRKLVEKLTFSTPRINAGHLAFSRSRDVVTISAPRDGLPKEGPGGLTIRVGNGPFETVTSPENVVQRMIGETLSLTIHEATGVLGTTNPTGNIVTFWDLKTKAFIKSLDLDTPRGIARTLDDECLAVSQGSGTVMLLSPATLSPLPEQHLTDCKLAGSHIYAWDPYARA
ncbi:MAG: DUF1513 domain-containing protein [Acidobacteriota bacterium]